jgi:small acid-soluble spore protein H (minor)
MKIQRAKDILAAEEEIAVHFHGIPVWIESIEETSGKAVISSRGSHEEKQIVELDGLIEE